MNPDLYRVLETERSATSAEISKAYRNAAKKAHPDAGGSEERFELVKLARDTLTDAARRARYDATGEVDSGGPNIQDAQAMNLVMGVFDEAMAHAVARALEPECSDFVANMADLLKRRRDAAAKNRRQQETSAERLRSIAKRFRAKDGRAERIGVMLVSRAAEFDRLAAQASADIETIERALEIVSDHEFRREKAAAMQNNPMVNEGSWR